MEKGERDKSGLYMFAKGLDKVVNVLAVILVLLLLLYAGHSLWYNHSLQNNSFLPDDIAKYRPDGRKPSLTDLQAINPDVGAWITIDDTHIDYPVVQGEDDNEYLNKSVLGEFSLAGSIFLCSTNKPDFSDPYSMVYGHHIEGGAMFTDVLEFRDASFFRTHKTGTLWYPDEGGKPRADRIEIFAALEAEGNDDVVYCDPSTVTKKTLPDVTDYIMKKAVQKRKVDIGPASRVIGLSTCENAVTFDRVLIFGKLRPMSEAEIRDAQAREKEGAASRGEEGLMDKILHWAWLLLPIIIALIIIILLWRKHRKKKKILKQ